MGEASAELVKSMLNVISEETRVIGNKLNEHARSIQVITNNPGPGSAAKAQKIVSISAMEINNYSVKIEELLSEYECSIDDFISNYSGFF